MATSRGRASRDVAGRTPGAQTATSTAPAAASATQQPSPPILAREATFVERARCGRGAARPAHWCSATRAQKPSPTILWASGRTSLPSSLRLSYTAPSCFSPQPSRLGTGGGTSRFSRHTTLSCYTSTTLPALQHRALPTQSQRRPRPSQRTGFARASSRCCCLGVSYPRQCATHSWPHSNPTVAWRTGRDMRWRLMQRTRRPRECLWIRTGKELNRDAPPLNPMRRPRTLSPPLCATTALRLTSSLCPWACASRVPKFRFCTA
mmetsp:Transcript_26712/g.50839  ORF Transcript_26712/g.50839 Transcript_26712/m.50839 type:complete len:264 (+) Transcript_26712:852-1643(+)